MNIIGNLIGRTVAEAVSAVASRNDNQLSPTAVEGAKPAIAHEAERAINAVLADKSVAMVATKSPFTMTTNWAQVIGVVATIAALFGLPIDPDTQKALVAGIVGLMGLYTVIRRTFFTKTITPAAAAKV